MIYRHHFRTFSFKDRLIFIQKICLDHGNTLSNEELEKFKAGCLSSLKAGSFVSTDDCLCALICQTIARARVERLDESQKMKFAIAVDARSFFGPNADQLGDC